MSFQKIIAFFIASLISQLALSAPVTFDFYTHYGASSDTSLPRESTDGKHTLLASGITRFSETRIGASNVGIGVNSCGNFNGRYGCNGGTISPGESLALEFEELVSLVSMTLTTPFGDSNFTIISDIANSLNGTTHYVDGYSPYSLGAFNFDGNMIGNKFTFTQRGSNVTLNDGETFTIDFGASVLSIS